MFYTVHMVYTVEMRGMREMRGLRGRQGRQRRKRGGPLSMGMAELRAETPFGK